MLVLAAVAALIEIFLSALLVGQPHPGFVLVAAISVGMIRGSAQGVLVAFCGGMVLDILAGPPLGRQTLALVLAMLPVFLKHTELARRTMLAPVLAVALGTVIYWIGIGLVDSALGLAVPWLWVLLRWTVPALLVNALLAWPVCHLVDRLTIRRGPRLLAPP